MKANLYFACSHVAKLLIICIICISKLYAQPAAIPITTTIQAGMNIGFSNDFVSNKVYADLIKTARDWTLQGTNTPLTASQLDVNGWPLQDADIYVYDGAPLMNGVYQLSFIGQANVVIAAGNNVSISSVSYNSNTNTSTAQITVGTPASNGKYTLRLSFRNTVGGIKNVRLLRPGSTSNDYFNNDFATAVAPFNCLRIQAYMNVATGSNTDCSVNWSSRARPGWKRNTAMILLPETFAINYPGWNNQTASATQVSLNLPSARAIPFEDMIALCNYTNKDIWLSIPVAANDTYITNLANLLKFGSDTTGTPYTSVQTNPINPPLNSNLNAYIELGNEVWNNIFEATNLNRHMAYQELSTLLLPGETSSIYPSAALPDWQIGYRRVMRRTVEISDRFKAVWGTGAGGINGRIRVYLPWQKGANGGISEMIKFFELKYPGRRLCDIVYAGGATSYYDPDFKDNTVNLNTIWTSKEMDLNHWIPTMTKDARIARTMNIRYIVYEGGPAFGDPAGSNVAGNIPSSVLGAAWADNRMYTSFRDHHLAWDMLGSDQMMYFNLPSGFEFGFTGNNITDLNTQKYNAWLSLRASSKPVITYGHTVPFSVNGNQWHLANEFFKNPVTTTSNLALKNTDFDKWYGYVYQAPTAKNYFVYITYKSNRAGQIKASLNGDNWNSSGIKTFDIVSTSGFVNSNAVSVWIPAGRMGSLRLKSLISTTGLDLQISSVHIQQTAPAREEIQNELFENTIEIYPNPSNGYFNLSAPAGSSYSVINLDGKEVSFDFTKTDNPLINVSMLPKGIYIIKIYNDRDTVFKKLIIE